MSRRCDLCERKPITITTRSHSNIASKKKQYLNLQARTIDGVKKKLCAKCLKTAKKSAV